MATKLNQVIEIEKGVKNRIHSAISELPKTAPKADLSYGFNKTSEPKDEEDID